MVKGRLRYIPNEADMFFNELMKEQQIPSLTDAMKRTIEYAKIGKETTKIAKGFGWSFDLK